MNISSFYIFLIALLGVFYSLISLCDYSLYDHIQYSSYYESLANISSFQENLFLLVTKLGSSDIFFALWSYLFSFLGFDYQGYHLSIVFFFVIILFYGVYTLTHSLLLSIILICSNYYAVGLSTSALRLDLALAFFILALLQDDYIKKSSSSISPLNRLSTYFLLVCSVSSHMQMAPICFAYILCFHYGFKFTDLSNIKFKKSYVYIFSVLVLFISTIFYIAMFTPSLDKYSFDQNLVAKASPILYSLLNPFLFAAPFLIIFLSSFFNRISSTYLGLRPKTTNFLFCCLIISCIYPDRYIFIPLTMLTALLSRSKKSIPYLVFLVLFGFQLYKLLSALPHFIQIGFFYS